MTWVWTVTTDGETRATACVIAVRRDALTVFVAVSSCCGEDCADDDALEAPWQAIAARVINGRAKRILMW